MDWSTVSEDQLFEHGGEQPGSQRSYDRDLEIRRRVFKFEKTAAEAQIAAASATVKAADATVSTARWTMISAIAVGLTIVVTGIGIWVDAFFKSAG
ncbi:hypothetical protein [Pararhizobium qamdonense]|uniref:hypothetical protein n=1 Tax=Pararhizobium qamdonense TaxID=3031126 RepID=UPI0023E0A4A3|nr:hypothetical protein [Pararhizobium qamdonense]